MKNLHSRNLLSLNWLDSNFVTNVISWPLQNSRVQFKYFALAETWHKFRFWAPIKMYILLNQLSLTWLNSNLVKSSVYNFWQIFKGWIWTFCISWNLAQILILSPWISFTLNKAFLTYFWLTELNKTSNLNQSWMNLNIHV